MSPDKAFHLGVDPRDVYVRSHRDRFGGNWVVFLRVEEGPHRVLTEGTIEYAASWVMKLERLAAR